MVKKPGKIKTFFGGREKNIIPNVLIYDGCCSFLLSPGMEYFLLILGKYVNKHTILFNSELQFKQITKIAESIYEHIRK